MLRFICALALVSLSLGFDHPRVACTTTKGPLLIEIYRDWAPLGADRFLDLVRDEFFTDIAFFRCVKRFLTQFGISDIPSKKHWHREEIPDDPNLHLGIKKNYLSFAGGGPNTRSTQLFIAFENLDFLGKEPWETPFGQVIEGQHTLDSLYKEYGDIPPFGHGPDQQKIHNKGNGYVRENFPEVDFIQSCHIVEPPVEVVPEIKPFVQEPVRSEERRVEEERKPVTNLRAGTRTEEKEERRAEDVQEEVPRQVLVVRKMSASRERDLIFRAVLILGTALTGLFLYIRYNAVTLPAKKL